MEREKIASPGAIENSNAKLEVQQSETVTRIKTSARSGGKSPKSAHKSMQSKSESFLPRTPTTAKKNVGKSKSEHQAPSSARAGTASYNHRSIQSGNVNKNKTRYKGPVKPLAPIGRPRTESSRAQSQRLKREYMEKLRKMHRVLVKPESANPKNTDKKKFEPMSQETIEKLEAEIADEVEKIKEQAKQAESRLARKMGGLWLRNMKRAKSARQQREQAEQQAEQERLRESQKWKGPFTVIRNPGEARQLMEKYGDTPEGVAAVFLVCMISRVVYPAAGYKLVFETLHPDCKTNPQNGERVTIRRHTLGLLRKFQEREYAGVLQSFIHGTSPEEGYNFNQQEFQIFIDQEESRNNSGAVDTFLTTSGNLPSYPNKRSVRCQKVGDKWYVRNMTDLVKPVQQIKLAAEVMRDTDKDKDYVVLRRDGRYGIQPPVDMGRAKKRVALKGRQEAEDVRLARLKKAEDDTKELAQRLTSAELNRKFKQQEPRKDHMVIEYEGDKTKKTLIPAGGDYGDGSTKVSVLTVEDDDRVAQEEKRKKAEEHDKRIRERIQSGLED
eukprot:m.89458 g.89458  ORF g.89458 m.89458 type:complete len:555 (-) comp13222_c0_seq1:1138-2802(-)